MGARWKRDGRSDAAPEFESLSLRQSLEASHSPAYWHCLENRWPLHAAREFESRRFRQ